MNEALRKAVDVTKFRKFAAMLADEATRPAVAAWANVLNGAAASINTLADAVDDAATHRDNYDALVIRLGEVTTRLEAANGLLRHVVLKHTGDDAEGCGMSDNDISAIQSHLKAADHV